MDVRKKQWTIFWMLTLAIGPLLVGAESCAGVSYTDGTDYFEKWAAKWTDAAQPDVAERMFPYGTTFCDISTNGAYVKDIPLPSTVTYYGRTYSTAYIAAMEGHISFESPQPIFGDSPLPNVFYPNQRDPVVAAPFYGSFLTTQSDSDVYYRYIDINSLDKPSIQGETLSRVDKEVVGRVMAGPEYSSFSAADYILIVTWVNVRDGTCRDGTACPSNTFQVIMAVQGENTIFMFNYEKIEWTKPTNSLGCQDGITVCPNVGALAGFNAGEMRGFTALPFSGTDSLPNLVTTRGASVAGRFIYHTSYDNVVRGGCTDNANILNTAEWHIEIFSRRVHMLGGVEIYVNGPCFKPTDTITCTFGTGDKTIDVVGYAVPDADETSDVSYMASCITPFLPWAGIVPVSVTYEGQSAYSSEVYVMSQPEQFATYEATGVQIADIETTAFTQNPESLTLTWPPKHLQHVFEAEQPPTVDVTLFAYSENPGAVEQTGTAKIEWGMAHEIARGVPNSGSYTFTTAEHRCGVSSTDDGTAGEPIKADAPSKPLPQDGRKDFPNAPTPTSTLKPTRTVGFVSHSTTPGKFSSTPSSLPSTETVPVPIEPDPISAASTAAASSCDWKVGAIKVSMSATDGRTPERSRGLWTTAIPLGWYSMPSSDPVGMCDAWYEKYEASRGADNTLPVCPCTYNQAMAEGSGRFTIDQDCIGEGSSCYWNPGSILCVVSTTPSASGGASRCCYGSDRFLIYAGDSEHGSFSSRAHFEGSFPYAEPGRVPLLSHWLHDLLPHLVCCDWTTDSDSCLHRYMASRPTRDCSAYHSPGLSTGYGDPHFRTMDGTEFTYNGKGEFWLVRSITTTAEGTNPLAEWEHIRIQVRLEQPKPILTPDGSVPYPDPLATAVTAIAVQEGSAVNSEVPKIEIRMNAASNLPSWQFPVSVYVDGTYLDLAPETGSGAFREFTNSDGSRSYVVIGDTARSHLTVVLPTGISVQATTVEKTVTFALALPSKYLEITEGLLGIWNHDRSDDLTIKGGGSASSVHEFGFSWVTTSEESIFTYVGLADWYSFVEGNEWQPVTEPTFPVGVTDLTEADVNNVCGTSQPCSFDYMVTMNEALAVATREHQKAFFDRANLTEDVPVCPRPNVAQAYVVAGGYVEGSSLTYTECADGYTLKGQTEYSCVLNAEGHAQWSSEVDTECVDSGLEAWKVAMAVVIPVVLVILLAIVGVIAYMKYGKKKNNKGNYNAGAHYRAPVEVARKPDEEKETVSLTGSVPQPARPLRSSMERIRMPPEETMPPVETPTRRDSLSTDDDDSYTPNSSQHQEYHPHDMEQQPHHAIGSAV